MKSVLIGKKKTGKALILCLRKTVIKVEIGNSMSQISGITQAQHKELAEKMSYLIDAQAAYFSGSPRGRKRTLLGKRGAFPTGLLYTVSKWVLGLPYYEIVDNRKLPEPRDGHFPLDLEHIPYEEQTDAAIACGKVHRGIVVAPTGVGKSLIAALIIAEVKVPTLIVVPTLELKRQLTESLADLFRYTGVGSLGQPIAVENVDALDPEKELTGYDCVIIDEFHHSGAKTYRTLNKKAWKNVYYRFGLTATPFRSRDNERLLLESVLSEVIYRIDYKTAVEKGYIVPLEAYYIDLPHVDTDGFSWSEVYSDLVVNNETRNKVIKNLIHSLEGQNVLTLVKEIKHGDWLRTISGSPFANGQDEGSRHLIGQFASGQVKSLIGTTGVLGEGVDTKPAEWVILAGLGKSKNAFMQQVGRVFRKFPGKESGKVILFRDPSHKWTLAHFNAQVKYLREEYGVKPVKLEL